MTTYADEADEANVSVLSKEEDVAAYVSADYTSARMSRTPSPASASKRSRSEFPASRERSADEKSTPYEYRRHSADTYEFTPPHQRSFSFAERLKSSLENAPSYFVLDSAKNESLEKTIALPVSTSGPAKSFDLKDVTFTG